MICLWHASSQLFDSFDPARIGTNSSKYGHGFYFCDSVAGAKGAVPGAKYIYKVEVDKDQIADFIKFDICIAKQGANIKAAADALKSHPPLSRYSSSGDANGDYLRLAAEDAALKIPGKYSRDILIKYGVKGFFVVDGRSESDRIVVVYDPRILRIRSIEFV